MELPFCLPGEPAPCLGHLIQHELVRQPPNLPYALVRVVVWVAALTHSPCLCVCVCVITSSKGKKGKGKPRVNKGLRHYSIKVCEKLSKTGVTTYNDIAEVLVAEDRMSPEELVSCQSALSPPSLALTH